MNLQDEKLRELRRIFSAVRDEGLEESQQERLEQLLAEEPHLRQQYLQLVVTESQLEQLHSRPLLSEEDLPDRDVGNELLPSSKQSEEEPSVASSRATLRKDIKVVEVPENLLKPESWSQKLLALSPGRLALATAALFLVAAVFGLSLLGHRGSATIVAVDMGGQEKCDYEVGDTLGTNWMQIESGVVRLSFQSSALVAVHGPAKFRALGSNRAELAWGGISVHVPDAAVGFRVTIDQIEVEDLGTGFSVSKSLDGDLSLHVTEGSVRLSDQVQGNQLTALAGQVLVAKPRPDGSSSFRLIDSAEKTPKVTGQLIFSEEHPRSLGYDAFELDNRAFLFLESIQRTLPFDMPVNFSSTGTYHTFDETAQVVSQGTVVDCYLVHCAPRSNSHRASGEATFAGEILGVIANHDRLNATNDILGANWTLQCNYVHRGLESAPANSADVVSISEDRHTISFTLRNVAIDQLRVLVKAN